MVSWTKNGTESLPGGQRLWTTTGCVQAIRPLESVTFARTEPSVQATSYRRSSALSAQPKLG